MAKLELEDLLKKAVVGMLLLLGSGCSTIPKFEWPERLSIPWLTRDVAQEALGILSIIEDNTEANAAAPTPTTWNAKKGAELGWMTGSLGLGALSVATCAPFLGGPPLYVACAAGGMAIGALGGAVVGGIMGDTAQRRYAWHSEVSSVIAALPGNTMLANTLHNALMQRAQSVTTDVLDLGSVTVSQLIARQATSPTKNILTVRSLNVSAARVGIREFRIVVSIHAERMEDGWLNYLKRTKYNYESPPISQEAPYEEKLAAATKAIDEGIQQIANNISKALIQRSTHYLHQPAIHAFLRSWPFHRRDAVNMRAWHGRSCFDFIAGPNTNGSGLEPVAGLEDPRHDGKA
jgi:hypothetical protein